MELEENDAEREGATGRRARRGGPEELLDERRTDNPEGNA